MTFKELSYPALAKLVERIVSNESYTPTVLSETVKARNLRMDHHKDTVGAGLPTINVIADIDSVILKQQNYKFWIVCCGSEKTIKRKNSVHAVQ